MDVGNSSYCKWTHQELYSEILQELLHSLCGEPNCAKITYVTLIRCTPVPTNYSEDFVNHYKSFLIQNGVLDFASINAINSTAGAPNAQ